MLYLVLILTGAAIGLLMLWAIHRTLNRRLWQRTAELERRSAAQAEAMSRLRLDEAIISLSEDQMLFVNTDYIFCAANEAYLKASKKTRDEVIGASIEEVVGKDFFERHIRKRLEQAMQGQTVPFELWTGKGHQPHRYLQGHYYPYTGSGGTIEGVVVVIHDMTDRENIRRELEKNQQSMRRLFGNLRGIAYRCEYTLEWPMQFISEGCRDLTGYSDQDFYDRKVFWGQLTLEADRRPVWEKITRAITRHQPFQVEYRIRDRSGHVKWVWEKGCGVYDSSGQVAALEGFITDITDRKQAEEQLTESRNLLQSILDTIPARVFWKDRDLNYLGCNQPFAQDAGLESPDQIIGKNDRQLSWQDQVDLYQQDDRDVIATGRPKLYYEEPQTTPDGRRICLLTSKVPLLAPDGSIRGVLGTYRDITDQKQAELAREKLLKELHTKNEELQSIVFIASHDLRSPLVNIRGFSGELEKSLETLKQILPTVQLSDDIRQQIDSLLNDDIPESLYFIKNSNKKMNALLNGLLRLSRIGTARLKPAVIDMNTLISGILGSLHFVISQNNIDIALENTLPPCRGDVTLITQAFENLIDNAVKYHHPDRPCKIRIRGYCQGDHCLYQIQDNGIGIDPQHHTKVFEIFHRLNTSGSGEGLGLTIVRRILDRQDGTIELDSEPEKGTTITITLPATAAGLFNDNSMSR